MARSTRIQKLINKYMWTFPLMVIVGTVFCLIALPHHDSEIDRGEVVVARKSYWFKPSVLQGVFVRDVFRSDDDEITIFLLKDHRNDIDLEIKIDGDFVKVPIGCYFPVCQGTFDQCTYQDYMGKLKVNLSTSIGDLMTLRLGFDGMEHTFKLIDSRNKGTFEHQLGVILQPAYYMADWQNLIQFFESWLAQGATKFFVYHYSWTRQVSDVIDFYKEQLGDNLEVLPWSSFPVREVDKGRFSVDANTRVFNLASEASLNNALYRAKASVKYMAMMDLDEIMYVNDETDVISLLDDLEEEYPESAQFSFEWVHSTAKIPLVLYEKPSDVSFDYLTTTKAVTRDSLADIYFKSRKVIHVTQKVELLDTHNTLRNKRIPGTANRYNTTYVDRERASVLHLRRIFEEVHTEKEEIHFLRDFSDYMTSNFENRIANSSFADTKMSPWIAEYKETLMTLHDCRRVTSSQYKEVVRGGLTQCRSVRGCEQFLGGQQHFIFAENSWTNLASRPDVLGDIFPVQI